MKKSLEDIIAENRLLFDEQEPFDGHFERFRKKINVHSSKTIRSIVPYLLKVAAVAVLVFLSSLGVFDHFIKPIAKSKTFIGASSEYKETEAYYIKQVSIKEQELKELDFSNNPEQLEILEKELADMDVMYLQLQQDMKKNSGDYRVINAMIEHYQTKLEVMTYIVDQLKNIQNDNSNSYDNEKKDI